MPRPIGHEHDLRDLAIVGPAGGDAFVSVPSCAPGPDCQDKIIRPDPARSSERLGITGIRRDVFYAHVAVCELVGARPP